MLRSALQKVALLLIQLDGHALPTHPESVQHLNPYSDIQPVIKTIKQKLARWSERDGFAHIGANLFTSKVSIRTLLRRVTCLRLRMPSHHSFSINPHPPVEGDVHRLFQLGKDLVYSLEIVHNSTPHAIILSISSSPQSNRGHAPPSAPSTGPFAEDSTT